MEPIDDLCLLIIRSIPSQAHLIQRQVAALLKQTIGLPRQRNRLNQDAKFSAGNLVKRLLTTIKERLKRKPEINLFQTHAECRSYLKYLCEMTNSPRKCTKRRICLVKGYCFKEKGWKLDKFFRSPTYPHNRPDPQTVNIVTTVGMALLRSHWSSIKDGEGNEHACRNFYLWLKKWSCGQFETRQGGTTCHLLISVDIIQIMITIRDDTEGVIEDCFYLGGSLGEDKSFHESHCFLVIPGKLSNCILFIQANDRLQH
ncbi:hypothetical protein Tco_0143634 [Tanacetum coccineum]